MACLALLLGTLAASVQAAEPDVQISEFMANNFRTLADEDGSYEDWIELHNATRITVNLNGWFLTDNASNLKKWRFPSTSIEPNGYLVVFASGKDRAPAFGELHTNFKLSTKPSYLGLVASNGVTVVSDYSPAYPQQVRGVSFGFPVQDNLITLVSPTNPARVSVPKDDSAGAGWTAIAFDDSAWSTGANGVGFETDIVNSFTPTPLADSVKEFSGIQGGNNWYYGYWDRGNDADGVYAPAEFLPFPRNGTLLGANNFFSNNVWHWFPASDARTELNRLGGVAAGDNGIDGGLNHWAVRRWVSETSGLIRIYGVLGDRSTCGDSSVGDGVIAHIYIDGLEVFSQAIRQTSVGYSITATVNTDSAVDLVIEPGGTRNDQCDNAAFTAVIATTSPSVQLLADSMGDWSATGDQGSRNWLYGFYNRSADTVVNYQTNDFEPFIDAFWNGTLWRWPEGNPPYDTVGQQSMHPNSSASTGGEHWVIRRWLSKVSGTLIVDWHLGKVGTLGSGLTGQLFHKGGIAKSKVTLSGTNVFGTNITTTLTSVQLGDPIDFVVDAGGTGGLDDLGDDALLDVRIFGTATLTPFINTDIKNAAQGINSSVYVRLPFTVADPNPIEQLKLDVRYDAGFVAYLNGAEVARENAPENATWNSAATRERSDGDTGPYASYDISFQKGALRPGANVLAIQALNSAASDSDLLVQARLSAGYVTFDSTSLRYFSTPTPGGPNGFGNTNLGPVVFSAQHTPNVPHPGDDLSVTVGVQPSFNPISKVVMIYRVMYGAETNVVMLDDGHHGDGLAADGIYGATIPGTTYQAGEMVRYKIQAFDTKANITVDPAFVKGKAIPEYWGTMATDPSMTNPLPVLYWFSQSAAAGQDNATVSLFWNDQFLDNLSFTVHGQSSRSFPKRSFNISMNPGYKLTWKQGEPTISGINLMTTFPDKAHMRNMLTYGIYKDAGTPYHYVFPVRVQLNKKFWGDAHFMENGDEDFLKRVGLDPRGSLYKMYTTFPGPDSTDEKKTRKAEDHTDITAFSNGLNLSGPARDAFLYDNANIPEVVNYLASMTISANTDCCHKNYYFYRDSEGTGEWQMLPWDQDLSFGRQWTGDYWDDTIYKNTSLRIGNNNRFVSSMFSVPAIDQMYLRRLRTLMEELMQTPETPPYAQKFERQIDEFIPLIAPDAALDLAKWGTFSGASGGGGNAGTDPLSLKNKQTLLEAANLIKYDYLPGVRKYLFTSVAEIPKSQPAIPNLLIGAIDYNPSSGNQDEEYFTLVNTNKISIDISHWRVTGAVDLTFQGGVVIPTNAVLYVSPNVNAFRARATGPHGGQRLFVQGNYKGHLSARGEGIQLVSTAGDVVISTNYLGSPSPAQTALRITEIMYHPLAPTGASPYLSDDFEYLELKNTGSTLLDLTGVQFVNGIQFSFSGSAVTQLAAGKTVLVVKSQAAFLSRYGTGHPIAGEYLGTLSNTGETLQLNDASGETILNFAYNNSWYRITDGIGFSLVIVNETAAWNTWGLAASWRPSGDFNGSPGTPDSGPSAIAPVTINEVRSHTESGANDAIELLNPTGVTAKVGGWYLTDDFQTPRKFRIPNGKTITAGGYLAIHESEFNSPGSPTAFSLSADGDEIYLFSADETTGVFTGYVTGFQFGAARDGVTFGPHTNSLGTVYFVPLAADTIGGVNSGPQTGSVVLSEIMYQPAEPSGTPAGSKLGYVELRNLSAVPVALFDVGNATNTWKITGGIQFSFPTNETLAANASLLLVNFDPIVDTAAKAAFLARYGTPNTVPLFGPYSGQLNNTGDDIALYEPDRPNITGSVPYALVDWVSYQGQAPWPGLAAGFGPALVRSPAGAYGNDPASWVAAKPSPGFDEAPGAQPSITQAPADGSPVAGTSPTLSIGATGGAPLAYQWIHDGQVISGATANTLVLPGIRLADWGTYQAVVMNPAGAVLSQPANLLVQAAAVITKQPISRNGVMASNVTFSVTAIGNGALRYQWLYNGLEITGATGSSNTVKNLTLANEGEYRVRVSDTFSSTLSDAATLLVYDRPQLLSAPQPVVVTVGEDATFSVLVSGRGPFNYKWQRLTVQKSNDFSVLNQSIYTVRNASVALAGNYSVVITNRAGVSITSPVAVLTVLADFDGDHIADVWEAARGFNTNSVADALLDPDGDRANNLAEYLADTDPLDPKSYLKIESLRSENNSTVLTFLARSNRTYTVEFKESLSAGQWQTLTNVMVQTNSRLETIQDPYPVSNGRLYRLATPAMLSRAMVTPVLLETPSSLSAVKGAAIHLSVLASGKGTLRYQWQKNGQPVPGATEATLSFGAVQLSDQGSYSVTLADDSGSLTTPAAELTVLDPPVIVKPPLSASVTQGSSVRFEVQATGNAPLEYRWLLNGVPIAKAEAISYSLPKASLGDAGQYSVIVRHQTPNGWVSIESESAELIVRQ